MQVIITIVIVFILIGLNPDNPYCFDTKGYSSIRVVIDDNYPPYTFRDKDNQLQGISIDRWKLWEKTTGINVTIIGMDWSKAQEFMMAGNADVIDTIFKNPERERIYSFSKPYARIDVPIFVHKNIQGISSVNELQGFTVGVKEGDAVVGILRSKGIHSLELFKNYETLINAVKEKRIWVFSVDRPPAYYLLHKLGIADDIMETEILYTGEFHMAVLKGNERLLNVIEAGFEQIDKTELERIDEKWIGKPIISGINYRIVRYILLGLLIIAALLVFWNILLRRAVENKTQQLTMAFESLRSSQRNLMLMNFAVDSSYDMVFRINKDGVIDYVNTTTCKQLKYDYDELISRNISDLTTKPKRLLDILNRIDLIKRTNIEMDFIDKDGVVFPTHLTLTCFEYEGDTFIYAFAKDISDIKAFEREVIKKERIESLGLLAGGIAHDFNNLLTVIVGNLSLLRMKSLNDDETLSFIDKAEMASEKARELTGKLSIFSKGGAPVKQTASLKHIINETVSFAITGKKVVCEVLIDEGIKEVDVDVTQIHQVLHNLIVNAIQAMPDEGKITIKAYNHFIDEKTRLPLPAGEYVKIEISDTGKGISPEHLQRIFDPYFTTKPDGSGLGLATVYSIINKHDGHISVNSEVGKGTTFFIYLPVSKKT
ncbi:MAG: transporter substrate-binding domain-containing protein [Thermodesulfovibrionales bacterium]|nr:transporter substrate-binding domain-containing protein [Thermodesulfovibrionales bacterium]